MFLRKTLLLLLCCLAIEGSMQAQNNIFNVTTSGTDSLIDLAIEEVTQIWSQHFVTTQPIKVKINYQDLTNQGPLGITFPNGIKDFPGAPETGIWYPTCLANGLTQMQLNPGEQDFEIFINSNSSLNWYFGLDGNPAFNQYDFVSVLLHEFGHGMGFISLAKSEGGEGSFGEITVFDFFPLGPTGFQFPLLEGLPGSFDTHVYNGDTVLLSDTNEFANPSAALAAEFTSNAVYFHGTESMAANGGAVKLYAPNSFSLGTSILHLDENAYPPGDTNTLMSPFIAKGESHHFIGPVTIALLHDLGWNMVTDVPMNIATQEAAIGVQVFPNPFQERLILQYQLPQTTDVRISFCDVMGREVAVLSQGQQASGKHQMVWDGNGRQGESLPNGIYLYTIHSPEHRVTGKVMLVK